MKHKLFWVLSLLLVGGLVTGLAGAQTNGYTLDWFTVDGGGGMSNTTGYTLSGTLGQADAGNATGGGYALSSGFWHVDGYELYLPFIAR